MFEVSGINLEDWKHFYPDYQEMIPCDIPESLGKYAVIKTYVGANHVGNM